LREYACSLYPSSMSAHTSETYWLTALSKYKEFALQRSLPPSNISIVNLSGMQPLSHPLNFQVSYLATQAADRKPKSSCWLFSSQHGNSHCLDPLHSLSSALNMILVVRYHQLVDCRFACGERSCLFVEIHLPTHHVCICIWWWDSSDAIPVHLDELIAYGVPDLLAERKRLSRIGVDISMA